MKKVFLLHLLIQCCAHHAAEIAQIVQKERTRLAGGGSRPVALRMDHFQGKGELRIPVRMVKGERDTTWLVKPYFGEVKLQKSTVLPEVYFVERKDSAIVELLRRHHITITEVKRPTEVAVTAYSVDSVRQAEIEEETQPLVAVTAHRITKTFNTGDFMISTHQVQALLIASILEPESMWGLTKYEQFASLLQHGQYPVFRLP